MPGDCTCKQCFCKVYQEFAAWRKARKESSSWSGTNLKVVCADGAFPVGSAWQRSFFSSCHDALYSVTNVGGGHKAWSSTYDDADVTWNIAGYGTIGRNNERAGRGEDKKWAPGIAQKVSRCVRTAEQDVNKHKNSAPCHCIAADFDTQCESVSVFVLCGGLCVIMHSNFGAKISQGEKAVLFSVTVWWRLFNVLTFFSYGERPL